MYLQYTNYTLDTLDTAVDHYCWRGVNGGDHFNPFLCRCKGKYLVPRVRGREYKRNTNEHKSKYDRGTHIKASNICRYCEMATRITLTTMHG